MMNSEKIIDYLSSLGIIDENKINNFLNIFSEITRNTSNNNNFDNNNIDIIKLSLFSFLRNISKNDKNLFELSRNIILSYNKFIIKELYKKLENVKWILYLKIKKIFIYFLFKTVQYALKKENYQSRLNKFKLKENNNNNNDNVNISLKKFHQNESNNFNTNSLTSFNRNIQNNNSNIPIKSFTYYSSAKNIQQKIPLNPQNLNENNNNIYSTTNLNYYNNNININYLKDYYDFYENENNHLERVNEKILNLKVQKMNELEQNCTFSPKINTNYQMKSNIYKILDEDDDNKKKMKRSKSNYAHFEKLYKEAKIKSEKQKELEKKNILNDNNFTFKPNISDNKKYKVKTTFNERTNKSIEIRKKKLDDIKNNIHPPLNDNFYFNGKRKSPNKNKYSKEEIIDTLYTKQLEKIKEKQNNFKKLNEKNEKKQIIDWKKKFDRMRKLDIERMKKFNRKLLEMDNNNNEQTNEILNNNNNKNNDEQNNNISIHNTIPDLNLEENNLLNNNEKNNDLIKNYKKENSLNNNNIEINSLSDVNTLNNLSNLDNNKVETEKTETDHIKVENAKSDSMRKYLAAINNNNNDNNENNDNNKDEKK